MGTHLWDLGAASPNKDHGLGRGRATERPGSKHTEHWEIDSALFY